MRTELPKLWHVISNKDNFEILSKWRFVDYPVTKLPPAGKIVGVCYPNGGKGHNPLDCVKDSGPNGYDFGERITFEEFKHLVLGESIQYEIY